MDDTLSDFRDGAPPPGTAAEQALLKLFQESSAVYKQRIATINNCYKADVLPVVGQGDAILKCPQCGQTFRTN